MIYYVAIIVFAIVRTATGVILGSLVVSGEEEKGRKLSMTTKVVAIASYAFFWPEAVFANWIYSKLQGGVND